MAVFAYKGVDASGKNVKGVQDADSAKALRAVLRKDGVFPTEILERAEAEKKAAREVNFKKLFSRVGPFDIALATRQLAVLLRSGIPLVEGLTALIEQLEQEDLQAAFTDARDKVNEGSSFNEALNYHPRIFSKLYVNMVAAGEASGNLEVVLERLAEFLENQAALNGKVKGALAYPAFMALLTVGILIMMMTVVVPKVTAIFEDLGQDLPWYTRFLIFNSNILIHYWWLLGILGVGAYIGVKKWMLVEKNRALFDAKALKAPLFGDLLIKAAIARFARTLGTLLNSGVPVLQAMDITRNVLGNEELMRVVDEARESVQEGNGLSRPLKESGVFPPIVTHMIAIGERSGQLEEMLEHVAKAYDQQVEVKVEAMTKLLEPIMILVMGGMSGGIAFSILMPLMQIQEALG